MGGAKSKQTPPRYKAQLVRDWLSGNYTKEQLMEKYDKSMFKVNLIIENAMENKRNVQI